MSVHLHLDPIIGLQSAPMAANSLTSPPPIAPAST